MSAWKTLVNDMPAEVNFVRHTNVWTFSRESIGLERIKLVKAVAGYYLSVSFV